MIYLGHYEEDIFLSLAKEEAMIELVKKGVGSLFFTARVLKPSITIAENEDIRDINLEKCLRDGIHLARRMGPGSAIWLDKGVLSYFFISPKTSVLEEFKLHEKLGYKIALALKSFGINPVYVGEKFSIALGPRANDVISGNAVILKRDYFLYHGILALEKWKVKRFKKYLVLRRNENIDEEKLIAELPAIYEKISRSITPKEISWQIAKYISEDMLLLASPYLKERWLNLAEPLVMKYKRSLESFSGIGITRSNMGFCLIALSETWQEKNFYQV